MVFKKKNQTDKLISKGGNIFRSIKTTPTSVELSWSIKVDLPIVNSIKLQGLIKTDTHHIVHNKDTLQLQQNGH